MLSTFKLKALTRYTFKKNGNKKIGNPENWKNDGKSAAIKVEKENENSGNAGRGIPSLPSGQDRSCAIASLTPYMNKWTIKGITIILPYLLMLVLARCTQKSEMRSWNNAKGSGKLFDFTVTDESCDLKCTAFKIDAEKYVFSLYQGLI